MPRISFINSIHPDDFRKKSAQTSIKKHLRPRAERRSTGGSRSSKGAERSTNSDTSDSRASEANASPEDKTAIRRISTSTSENTSERRGSTEYEIVTQLRSYVSSLGPAVISKDFSRLPQYSDKRVRVDSLLTECTALASSSRRVGSPC